MTIDLTGQVALVTGGLGDIGLATARALASAGADVAVSDLAPPDEGESWTREGAAMGRRARYDRVDVTDAEALKAWVEGVEGAFGSPTLGVINAAVFAVGGSLALEPAAWRRQIEVNLDGAFYTAQAIARRMAVSGRGGRLVFVGSWAAERPHTQLPAYCAAKAGLRMLMRCMAAELASRGILVNEIAPGYVDAGLSAKRFREEPGVREAAARQTPVGQLIEADEVARQVVTLCDPRNRHLTGHALTFDGGLSLLSPATPRDAEVNQ